jgi:hypothetical protein
MEHRGGQWTSKWGGKKSKRGIKLINFRILSVDLRVSVTGMVSSLLDVRG